MLLAASTWNQLEDRAPLLLVPVGSCEQHGPHLPLGADTLIAEAIARGAAEQLGADVVVAPALAITASGEHQGFPGTLSIGTPALTTVLVELVRSAGWAGGVVLVNGHGGNADAVGEAARRLRDEDREPLVWWPHVPGGDAHAGITETSLLLALHPELVRPDLAAVGATAPLDELLADLRLGGVRAVSQNGVLGDPTGATAEAGAATLAALVEQLVTAVKAWHGVRPTAAMPARDTSG